MRERPLTEHIRHDREPLSLNEYERVGGYQALRKVLLGMTPAEVLEEVKQSNLRGRGGAGFPTGLKWSFVPTEDVACHRYLIANADEMEPGTFKDRLLLEGNPHQLLEGIILAAYAIRADVAYVFLRWAYRQAARGITRAIAEAYDAGYLGQNILGSGFHLELYLHNSAGRYICGEETGLLNALEGQRPVPRARPPYPQVCGLWGNDTIVNNVETLCNVPHIVNKGAEWFKSLSHSKKDGGTKLYGASGKVKKTGLWELPMGTTIREVLENYAGGMREGFAFKGVLPGGASTNFLTGKHLDVKMDFDSVSKAGSRMGTGTMIVLDDQTCPVGLLLNLQRFFARESCGWCTPCRDGLPWVARILQAIEDGKGQPDDLERLTAHARLLAPGHTYCALAPGAMEPLQSALKYFREDFEQHVRQQQCSWQRHGGNN